MEKVCTNNNVLEYRVSTSWTNGTKVPGPFHSWERKFQGATGPGSESFRERIGQGFIG